MPAHESQVIHVRDFIPNLQPTWATLGPEALDQRTALAQGQVNLILGRLQGGMKTLG
jgi:hypothetical protein